MKVKVCYLFITIISLLVINVTTSIPITHQIISNNTTHYVGGTGPGNYSTIQQAISNASDGDTIYIYPGIYHETLTLNKKILLHGHDVETTKIYSNTTALTISSDECTLEYLTISGNTRGIYIALAKRITLTENHITGCTIGILIDASILSFSFINIIDNLIENNNIGISTHVSLINIASNTIISNQLAIEHHGILSNIGLNRISNNTDGLKINGYINNVARNAITYNSFGLLCYGHITNIHHNNFLVNTENYYVETSFFNRWLNNFWTKPRIAPYPIRGTIPTPGGSSIAYYDFDPFPRVVPNTIPP